jgi:hypothetical protein
MIDKLISGGLSKKITLLGYLGQSNNEGVVARILLPASYEGVQTNIKIWWEGLPSAPITPTFQNMEAGVNTVHPYHRDPATYDSSYQWGPEQSSSHILKDRLNKNIYLYKNAFGGLSIDYWRAPNGQRWIELKRYVEGITAWCLANDLVPDFAGVLFAQGETNVLYNTPIAEYEADYRALINNFRSINQYVSNTMWVALKMRSNVIAGGGGEPLLQSINNLFQTVANENPSINKVIDPDAIGATGPDVHYSAEGYVKVGEAFANLIH